MSCGQNGRFFSESFGGDFDLSLEDMKFVMKVGVGNVSKLGAEIDNIQILSMDLEANGFGWHVKPSCPLAYVKGIGAVESEVGGCRDNGLNPRGEVESDSALRKLETRASFQRHLLRGGGAVATAIVSESELSAGGGFDGQALR